MRPSKFAFALILLAGFAAAFSPVQSVAQPPDQSVIIERLEAIESRPAADGPKIDREEVAAMIVQAAKQSDLRPFQKRRIERVMESPFRSVAKDRMINRVTQNLLDTGAIEVGPDGTQAAIDIRAIITAIEKWLPVLLQLLSLFGL